MIEPEMLVSINVPPLLEEGVVDCLLAIAAVDRFNSAVVNAHGCDHEVMTLSEQVTGRQRQVNFQVYLAESQVLNLINHLKTDFSGSGIQYWVSPVLDSGYI